MNLTRTYGPRTGYDFAFNLVRLAKPGAQSTKTGSTCGDQPRFWTMTESP